MTTSFGDAAAELHALVSTCGLADRSELGRLRASGKDALDLLHRLSTADLRGLAPGEGRPTVLTTGKGRIVSRLFVHALEGEGVLLVTGPGEAAAVRAHLDRFTFAEDVGLTDATAETCQFVLAGPRVPEALEAGSLPRPGPYGALRCEVGGRPAWIVGQDGHAAAGVSLIAGVGDGGPIWSELRQAIARVGGLPAGPAAFEAWRVLQGYPAAGHELTPERNPLEAGLKEAISFTKGCYVGQEVVARLRTYDRVSRCLVGLAFPPDEALPVEGSALFHEGREIGEATSVVAPPGRQGAIALAFVKRSAATPGTIVRVGGPEATMSATVVTIPFEPPA